MLSVVRKFRTTVRFFRTLVSILEITHQTRALSHCGRFCEAFAAWLETCTLETKQEEFAKAYRIVALLTGPSNSFEKLIS